MAVRENFADRLLPVAMLAGVSYAASGALGLDPLILTIWKGAGVGLLALWAALRARDADGWLLAAVMAFGAAGDVLLETSGLTVGALAFALGHLTAISLYARNRRVRLGRSQTLLAVLIVPLVTITAWSLPSDRSQAMLIAVYALLLAIMAAMAWTSAFSRFRAGIGAMMFVASDLLIFARLGPLADTITVGVAVWLLYFFGQWLIANGVGAVVHRPAPLR